jgi:hypothetical protein
MIEEEIEKIGKEETKKEIIEIKIGKNKGPM